MSLLFGMDFIGQLWKRMQCFEEGKVEIMEIPKKTVTSTLAFTELLQGEGIRILEFSKAKFSFPSIF